MKTINCLLFDRLWMGDLSMRHSINCKHLCFALGIASAAILAAWQFANADDFRVETTTHVQNGHAGNTLDGNDTLTITNSGEIIVNGVDGVLASGDENTLVNSGRIDVVVDTFHGVNLLGDSNYILNGSQGTIIVTGENGRGIEAQTGNTIHNQGQILTFGQGGEGMEVDDNNFINNSGLISTNGAQADGISVRNNNFVQNDGTIITYQNNAEGIDGNTFNTVINNGAIITFGDIARGIEGDDNSLIVNNGTIESYGDPGIGIYITDESFILNNGEILVETGVGVLVGNDNELVNNGTIRSVSDVSRTQALGGTSRNTILNKGMIETHGPDFPAITVFDDNTVTNSGSVTALGLNSDSFRIASHNNNITNSGKTVSANGRSFFFDDVSTAGGNTLNLEAPSFIGGEIDLGSAFTTDTTVNITTGASHSTLWDFSTGELLGDDPVIGGTVPWFYNTASKQVATFDPTILTTSVETLTDRTALISVTIQRRLEAAELVINGVQRGKPDGSGTRREAGNFDKSGAWAQVMASQSNNGGSVSTLDRNITLGGLAIGYEANVGISKRFGVMAGYIDGTSDAASRWSNSFESRSSGFFAAGYGRKGFDRIFLDFGLSAGVNTNNETKRFVNDNLAALGKSYAMGDAGASFWISPEITVGTQISGGSNWTFAPSAKLRYAAEWFGGYTETGPSTDAHATVDAHMVAIGEARLEVAASRIVAFSKSMQALITVRGGALGRASIGGNATITMLDVTQSVADYFEDSFAVFAGMDTTFAISDMLNLDLSASATYGNDITRVHGSVALGVVF